MLPRGKPCSAILECWPGAGSGLVVLGKQQSPPKGPVVCLECLLPRSRQGSCLQAVKKAVQALQLARRPGLGACLPARHRAGSFRAVPRWGCRTTLHRRQPFTALSFKANATTSLHTATWVALRFDSQLVCAPALPHSPAPDGTCSIHALLMHCMLRWIRMVCQQAVIS